MWITLEVGAMCFAPYYYFVRKHDAFWCNEGTRAVLLLEGDRETACLQQAENIACGPVGKPSLVGDDVMFCAITRSDIVLGHDDHQIGITGDLIDLLRLALGDKSTESMLRVMALFRFCVHGLLQKLFQIEPAR